MPRRVLAALMPVLLVAAPLAAGGGALTDDGMFPRGHPHFTRCWRLEHDYYALRRRIAETGVVWRRAQLELQWEEVRDARRESCLLGW